MDTKTLLVLIIVAASLFFMFKFQHLQTLNQTLATENQTLKTVVPMFNRNRNAEELSSRSNINQQQANQHDSAQPNVPSPQTQLNATTPILSYDQDPTLPLSSNQQMPSLVPVPSGAPASTQGRRGRANPFPPNEESKENEDRYGIGREYQSLSRDLSLGRQLGPQLSRDPISHAQFTEPALAIGPEENRDYI